MGEPSDRLDGSGSRSYANSDNRARAANVTRQPGECCRTTGNYVAPPERPERLGPRCNTHPHHRALAQELFRLDRLNDGRLD